MSTENDPIAKIRFIHGLMKKEVDELLRMMERNNNIAETSTPPMDAKVREGKVIVTAELPGLSTEDFTVYLYENLLILEGIRKRYCTDKKIFFIRAEREFAPFRRVMQLPFSINKENATAALKNGVLTVTLNHVDNEPGEE
jgi:HSP20 family protein